MSSHRDPRFAQNDPRRNPHAPTSQGMTQQNSEAFFIDYIPGNPEHLAAGGYPSTFGAGGLARLGPEYHPTNTPSAASSSTFGQPDYSYPTAGSNLSAAARVRSREAPNVYPLNANQPAFPPVTLHDWQQSPYTADVSPAVSVSIAAHSLSTTGVIGYASQRNVTDPYMGDYVSPIAPPPPPQPGFDFQPWPPVDDGTMSLGTASPSSLMSPVMQSYEMVASPTGSGIDESTMGMYGGPEGWQQLPPSRTNSMETGSPGGGGKRAKQYTEQSASSPVIAAPNKSGANSSSTGGTAKTKLRSASRTSKNMQTRNEETPQERKSRNSHNLVEKQYRNRLNMQFEILMNTLPESMRSPTTTASGADSDVGQGGQGGVGMDLGERRLSKAQVLDMSTRYIRALERDREKLEREREELLLGMAKMREAYEKKDGSGSGSGTGTGGGKGKGAG